MEAHEARLNITYKNQNGDMPDPVTFDSTDGDIRAWVTEALRNGGVPGVNADPNADVSNYVIDRFAAEGELPNRLMIRPKTAFG